MKKKRNKIDLDKVTHEDIIVSLFVRTLIDALDSSDQNYWNILNLRQRLRFAHEKMQNSSMSNKIKYTTAHNMSDIAWQKSRQDGSMIFSAVASIAPMMRHYEENFNRIIGPVDSQINGIVNYYYGRENLKEVQLNSWKIMKRLMKHTNSVLYGWNKDKENYLFENKVSYIEKLT